MQTILNAISFWDLVGILAVSYSIISGAGTEIER